MKTKKPGGYKQMKGRARSRNTTIPLKHYTTFGSNGAQKKVPVTGGFDDGPWSRRRASGTVGAWRARRSSDSATSLERIGAIRPRGGAATTV